MMFGLWKPNNTKLLTTPATNTTPKGVAEVLFWCTLHHQYDADCYRLFHCPRHPNGQELWSQRECTCDGEGWESFPVVRREDVPCRCTCHERASNRIQTCSWCCKNGKASVRCQCICHTRWEAHCGQMYGYANKCCQNARAAGETDEEPKLFDVMPASSSLTLRTIGGNKETMGETIHLDMTIDGGEVAQDMFHVILHYLDKDYPIKPMRKVGDLVPYCDECKGVVWHHCVLSAEHVARAALQASRLTGEDVFVKIHHFRRGRKCSGTFTYHTITAPPTTATTTTGSD